jgi:hypothetical protein
MSRVGRPALGLVLVFALAGACGLPRPYGEGVTLHTEALGGYRVLDRDDFDGHPVYALELVTCERESGWGYELGGSYGTEDEGGPREHSAEFNELYLGVRRSWAPADSRARPYLSLGGAFTRVEHDLHSPRSEFEEDGGGAYLRAGVLWLLGPLPFEHGTDVLVGFDVKGMASDDYDSAALALVMGFGR